MCRGPGPEDGARDEGGMRWVQTCRATVDGGLLRGMGVLPGDPQNTRENLRQPEVKKRWIYLFLWIVYQSV